MNEQAEKAADVEYQVRAKLARSMKYRTKGTAADDELVDNVFFSPHAMKTTTGCNTKMTVNPNRHKRSRKRVEEAANLAR